MRFATSLLAILFLLPLALGPAGCRRAEPPPPPPAPPASIWKADDAQWLAGQLVEAVSRDAWASQFRDRNSRALRVAVGEIIDTSGERIAMDEVTASLRSALASGGEKIALAEDPAAADFVLGGKISASPGTVEGRKVTFFDIDLRLREAATGADAWPFSITRQIP